MNNLTTEFKSFADVANVLPSTLLNGLIKKYPFIQESKSLPPKQIFGFDTSDRIEADAYSLLKNHQEAIQKILPQIKEDFNLSPIAVVPIEELRRAIVATPELYLFEEVSSDGTCDIHPDYFYMLNELPYLTSIANNYQHSSLGDFIQMLKNLSSSHHIKYINFLLENFICNPEDSHGIENGDKMSRIQLLKAQINKFQERYHEICFDSSPEFRIFTSRESTIEYTAMYINDSSSKAIFERKCQLKFIDANMEVFELLGRMDSMQIKPFIIAEKSAVIVELKKLPIPAPSNTFDPCPIIGYKVQGTEYIAFLKQFGQLQLPVEEEFTINMKRSYLRKYFGNENWAN